VSRFKAAFNLITNIQNEMHRYAVTYQRKKHSKSTFQLELTKVKGIGIKKAQKLIMHYKTKSALENATAEELADIAGINISTARQLYDAIHGEYE
jgi:excinuclease ABC subunit C